MVDTSGIRVRMKVFGSCGNRLTCPGPSSATVSLSPGRYATHRVTGITVLGITVLPSWPVGDLVSGLLFDVLDQ
jgi:hypothetical protein